MSDVESFKLVLRVAEAHANGHEHCGKILAAVERCRAIVKIMKSKTDLAVAELKQPDQQTFLI